MTFPKPADYPFWFRLVVVITLALFTVNLFFFVAPTLAFVTWAAANVNGFTAWLQKWQTMASASVALGAAFLAFHNTTRSIRGAREQETHRRKRKQSAVRAVLPIALSDLTSYAEQSANQLNKVSPTMGMTDSHIEPIPTKAIETFADFIEYPDAVDVAVVEATTAFVQIFNSRLRALTDADTPTTQWEIAARILDAASIYAGAAAVYAYARRQKEQLPHSVSWGDVRGALSNMGFLEGEHEDLDKMLEGRKKLSAGPFDHLARRSTCPAGLELEAVKSTEARSGRSEAT